MKIKSPILLIFILTLAFISCNKGTPSGFWKNYKTDLLVKNISDQGPNGGHRADHWKSEKPFSFDAKNVLDFATKNGWTLTDSSEFDQNQTRNWVYNNTEIFPLTSTGFDDKMKNDQTYNYFPRWFEGQIKLYKFKTGWVTIEPGTNRTIEENGFVVINQDKSELAVYHLWGD